MPAVNVSSNISKRKKPIVEPITPYRNCTYPCLSILKDSTSKRPHGSLGMLTPNENEELFWNQV